MTISGRIFNVLQKTGKKQADLAKYAGVRSNTVSDWKNKNINPLSIPLDGYRRD